MIVTAAPPSLQQKIAYLKEIIALLKTDNQ